MEEKYVIGIDRGVDSVNALLVDAADGRVVASAVGKDMVPTVKQLLEKSQESIAEKVVGLGFETEGRAPVFFDGYEDDKTVGRLSQSWAESLGLPAGIAVVRGASDCHIGAVEAGIKPDTFVRVLGTSACDVMVSGHEEIGDNLDKGVCGLPDDSIIPETLGLAPGESTFGKVFDWLRRVLEFPLTHIVMESRLITEEAKAQIVAEASSKMLDELTLEAQGISPKDSAPVAVDWIAGDKPNDDKSALRLAIVDVALDASAPMIYRALVEAAAFNSRNIIERLGREGFHVESIVGVGGIAIKMPFVMQILCDVLGMPIRIGEGDDACAMDAAMFAAVAAGVYRNIEDAMKRMGVSCTREYTPNETNAEIYNRLYKRYVRLESFVAAPNQKD